MAGCQYLPIYFIKPYLGLFLTPGIMPKSMNLSIYQTTSQRWWQVVQFWRKRLGYKFRLFAKKPCFLVMQTKAVNGYEMAVISFRIDMVRKSN